MHHRSPMHRIARLSLACLLVAALAPWSARADSSTEIMSETARPLEGGGGHVASFWWLPQEYWEQVAKELKLPAADQEKVRVVFRDYLLVGAFDMKLSADKKPELAGIAEIVKHASFYRNGEKIEVLRDANPELVRLTRSLVVLLRASLGGIGEGLRLLPLPNVDAQGKPILSGRAPGELRLEYRLDEAGPAHEVYWRAPITAIAGAKKCPKGGEKLEASFEYCPWHGVKLGGKP